MTGQFLKGVNRASLIKWTAVYLIVFTVINGCSGFALGILGASAGALGADGIEFLNSADAAAASSALSAFGGLTLVVGLLYLISVPIFAVAAWGLWQRKRWARIGAVIALALSVVLSLLAINTDFSAIIWVLVSAIGVYIYWADEGVRQELTE